MIKRARARDSNGVVYFYHANRFGDNRLGPCRSLSRHSMPITAVDSSALATRTSHGEAGNIDPCCGESVIANRYAIGSAQKKTHRGAPFAKAALSLSALTSQ